MLSRRRFLTVSAAWLAAPAQAATQLWQGRALGADVTVRLAGEPRQAARIWRKIAGILRQAERQFSLFDNSELTRLNRLGRLSFPSADMRTLCELATRVHHATGGVFDPSVQPLWQAVAQGGTIPAVETRVGWNRVEIADDEIRLGRGMALTFNGIAQGYAADRLAGLMRAEGCNDVLIDAGEVQALGRRGDGTGWRAGIAGPDGRMLRQIRLSDRALATSSPMGTQIGSGKAHILHPSRPEPVWGTASVSASSAALADALSTAFCLMSEAEIAAALAQFEGARIENLG